MKKSIFIALFAFVALISDAQIDTHTSITQVDVPDIHLTGHVEGGKVKRTIAVEVIVYDSASANQLFSRGKDVYKDSLNNVTYDNYNSGSDILTPYYTKRGLSVPSNLQDSAFYNKPPYPQARLHPSFTR